MLTYSFNVNRMERIIGMNIKKDIIKVFTSNVINLLIGIVMSFLVPAFLSLDQYAFLKTFTLYVGYVGILHFGFNDGIYIKYGGKQQDEIDKEELKGEHKFIFLFQLAITIIMCVIGFLINDMVLVAFSICILPMNLQSLFRFLYQALGEFNIYSKIMVIPSILLLLINLFNIYILKINNSWPFILGNIIVYYLVFIVLELHYLKNNKNVSAKIEYSEITKHFKVGFVIMIANLSVMFFYSIDTWFVKYFLPIEDFAFYSFAISMLNVVNIIINSITLTLYPYLSRNQEQVMINKLKKYFIIIGTLASGAYFCFDFIISKFLSKYVSSLSIISILFMAYPAIIVINAIYINLYKSRKLEKEYAFTVFKMLILSIILNYLAIFINKSSLSIAAATTLSFYVWYFYSKKDFKEIKIDRFEILYLFLSTIVFLFVNNKFNWLYGFVIYYLLIITIDFLFYKNEVIELIKNVLKIK